MIPYARQSIDESDVAAVVAALRSDWLTQGPTIERFERMTAEHCGARFAVATTNATAALHLACRALDLGPGDWLWTSPNSFVASANCALYCGASVDFVDIDPRTYTMSVEHLASKLRAAQLAGRLPKIVIPVDFAGQPCDLKPIKELADRYGFAIVEDASHAIGASYLDSSVGDCAFADITIFSFHPVKIITTGEGGMALTNDRKLAERIARLRSHGITRDPAVMDAPAEGPWYYQQIELGWNYRMTEMSAALGCAQLIRLETFIDRRRALAAHYNALLEDLPVTRPWQHPSGVSAYHLYPIRVAERRRVFEDLTAAGIRVNVHYIPIHMQPYYRGLGFKRGDFPEAERYYDEALSLPMFADLRDEDVACVVAELERTLGVIRRSAVH